MTALVTAPESCAAPSLDNHSRSFSSSRARPMLGAKSQSTAASAGPGRCRPIRVTSSSCEGEIDAATLPTTCSSVASPLVLVLALLVLVLLVLLVLVLLMAV